MSDRASPSFSQNLADNWRQGVALCIGSAPPIIDIVRPVGLKRGADGVYIPGIQQPGKGGILPPEFTPPPWMILRSSCRSWCQVCAVPLSGGGGKKPSLACRFQRIAGGEQQRHHASQDAKKPAQFRCPRIEAMFWARYDSAYSWIPRAPSPYVACAALHAALRPPLRRPALPGPP